MKAWEGSDWDLFLINGDGVGYSYPEEYKLRLLKRNCHSKCLSYGNILHTGVYEFFDKTCKIQYHEYADVDWATRNDCYENIVFPDL